MEPWVGRSVRAIAKGSHCGRTKLIPGPDSEVRTGRRIFELYVTHKMSVAAIARLLNVEGIPGPNGAWPTHLVHDVLSNEKYIGTNIINKTRRRLGANSARQPHDEWLRTGQALLRLVFDAARARRLRARRKFTGAEMIAGVARLHRAEGRVSSRLVDACPDIPSSQSYCLRFGSLLATPFATCKSLIGTV